MHYQNIKINNVRVMVGSNLQDDSTVRRFSVKTAKEILDHLKDHTKQYTILDIGGNVGGVAVILGKILTNSKIYTVEPHPLCYEILLENIKTNNIQNVIPFNTAIGEEFKFISKNKIHNKTITGTAITSIIGNESTHTKTSSTSLDDFISKIGSDIDVLKMDIEGSEYSVLSKFTSWNKVKSFHLEFHKVPDGDFLSKSQIIEKIGAESFINKDEL